MNAVAGAADVAICTGGHGITSALFLAGVPMLFAPGNVEQLLLARRLALLRSGGLLSSPLEIRRFSEQAAGALNRWSAQGVHTPAAKRKAIALKPHEGIARIDRWLATQAKTPIRFAECV